MTDRKQEYTILTEKCIIKTTIRLEQNNFSSKYAIER